MTGRDSGEGTSEPSPLAGIKEGETLRVTLSESDDVIVGTAEAPRSNSEGDVQSDSLTVDSLDLRGPMWDLDVQFDPRYGWCEVQVTRRVYETEPTEFIEKGHGTVEVIEPGIDPDRLDPGVTVEAIDASRYRVVVAPWEREYDSKVLAFNLDNRSNVLEKLSPREVIKRVN